MIKPWFFLIALVTIATDWVATSAAPSAAPVAMLVVDDAGTGVESDLSILRVNGSTEQLGRTDADGRLTRDFECTGGDVLQVRPISTAYYPEEDPCDGPPSEWMIRVDLKDWRQSLANNAGFLVREGRWADAALAFSELGARLQGTDPVSSAIARRNAITLFARHLAENELLAADDVLRVQEVGITAQFNVAVAAFRASASLGPGPALDYATLSAAAEADISAYLFFSHTTMDAEIAEIVRSCCAN